MTGPPVNNLFGSGQPQMQASNPPPMQMQGPGMGFQQPIPAPVPVQQKPMMAQPAMPQPKYDVKMEEEKEPPRQNMNPFGAMDGPIPEAAMDLTSKCFYCNKMITTLQESNGERQMFVGTECYHSFHVDCFRTYFKQNIAKTNPVQQQPINNHVGMQP